MKWKAGDLALTFGAPQDNGLLVELLHYYGEHVWAGPCWMVRSLGSQFHMTPTTCSERAVWPGKMLKPMGRPGEGTSDETPLRLPAPREAVPA